MDVFAAVLGAGCGNTARCGVGRGRSRVGEQQCGEAPWCGRVWHQHLLWGWMISSRVGGSQVDKQGGRPAGCKSNRVMYHDRGTG